MIGDFLRIVFILYLFESRSYALLDQPTDVNRMPFGKYQGNNLSEVPPNYFAWLQNSGALDKPNNKDLKERHPKNGHFEVT